MNNYCTNCGKKLSGGELVCKKCNTPIIKLDKNYKFTSKKTKNIKKVFFIVVIVFILIIISLFSIHMLSVYKLKNEYVIPFIENELHEKNYKVRYDSSGKCIVSGNCYFDPVQGCDGGICSQYEYSKDKNCKSYYYSVKVKNESFFVTVVKKGNKFYTVKGKNINGEETSEQDIDEESDTSDIKTKEISEQDNKNDLNEKAIVDNYPFLSEFYEFNSSEYGSIILDKNNNAKLNFSSGVLSDKSKIHVSGSIYNPLFFKGNLELETYFYDSNYDEVGVCKDNVNLLGPGYTYISYSCNLPVSELKNNKSLEDVMYYKIKLESYKIEE